MVQISPNKNSQKELIYGELSYDLVGLAFKTYNTLGYGLHEKYYHRGYAQELLSKGIPFEQEVCVEISYNGKTIGKCFLDFLVDRKIIVEWKVVPTMLPYKQVYGYLRAARSPLAIIVYVTRDGIKFKRVINPDFKQYSDIIRT